MHIQKSISRNINQKYAEFPNGIHKIFEYNIFQDVINGTVRSYADLTAYNFNGYQDDGRQIDDYGFSIPKSELDLDSTITDPYKQIEQAVYTYLIAHDARYANGTIVETEEEQ